MAYGLNPYIREYFTREYFNTTAPSNREFKNAKIANPRNINPAKIKAHTVIYIYIGNLNLDLNVIFPKWKQPFCTNTRVGQVKGERQGQVQSPK